MVKKHMLIYTFMDEEINSGMIHALQSKVRTQSEQ